MANWFWLSYLIPLLNAASAILFLITGLIYLCVMKDVQSKCIAHYSICMGISHVFFGTYHHFSTNFMHDYLCITYAIISAYFTTCGFIWMHILSFNTWMTARNKDITQTRIKLYYTIGYAFPAVWISCLTILNHSRKLTQGCARISSFSVEGSMLLLLILLSISLFYFIDSQCRLWKIQQDSAPSQSFLKKIAYRTFLYVKLSAIMSVPWMFGLIYAICFVPFLFFYIPVLSEFFYVVVAMLLCEGITFFILMVLARRKVLRAVANKKICNYYIFGGRCRTVHHSETEENDDIDMRYNAQYETTETIPPKKPSETDNDNNETTENVIPEKSSRSVEDEKETTEIINSKNPSIFDEDKNVTTEIIPKKSSESNQYSILIDTS